MTITEKHDARYGTAPPPIPPLVIQIPMRGGKFTALIMIPLDVTEGELRLISKTIMIQPARKDSWRLEPHEYIAGEREPEREPTLIERMDHVDALLQQRNQR
jgi:hypothetical protein